MAAADPARLLPGRLPPPPAGRTVVVGAGKAAASHGRRLRARLALSARGSRGHALRPWRTLRAHRGDRGGTPGAGCRRARGGRAHPRAGRGPGCERPARVPHLGRRLVAAGAARRRLDARRQAGREPAPAALGRDHRRDELRAQTPLGDQRRPPRRRRAPRSCRHVPDQRRVRRRSVGHRIWADRARPDHVRRGARRARAVRHRRAGRGTGVPARRRGRSGRRRVRAGRDTQAGRPRVRRGRARHAGDRPRRAEGGRGGGARRRRDRRAPRRRPGGRGARARRPSRPAGLGHAAGRREHAGRAPRSGRGRRRPPGGAGAHPAASTAHLPVRRARRR